MRFSKKSFFAALVTFALLGLISYRLENPHKEVTASQLSSEILPSENYEAIASHSAEYCEQVGDKNCRTFDLSVFEVKEPLPKTFDRLHSYIVANEWQHSDVKLTDRIKDKGVLFDELNKLYDAQEKRSKSFKNKDDALNYFAVALINGGFFDKQAFLYKDDKALVVSILRVDEDKEENRLAYIKQIFPGTDEQVAQLEEYVVEHPGATLLGVAVADE